MSELNNNAEELVEDIEIEVDDSPVVPTPIDPTLTRSGQAADAKATGDKINAVIGKLKVNNKGATNDEITIYAGDILISSEEGAQTVVEAIEEAAEKDATDIMYDSNEMVSVKDALDDIYDQLETDLTADEIEEIFDEVFGTTGGED